MNKQNNTGVDEIFDGDNAWTRTNPPNGDLYYGDCHKFLSGNNYRGERYIPDRSVDLIYLDPPYSSDKKYNLTYDDNTTQRMAYNDTWKWNPKSDDEYKELVRMNTDISKIIVGLKQMLGKTSLFAYLVYMAFRLTDLYRVLKSTGSIYFHCDPKAGHYIKIVMDGIFGRDNFRNEIIWHYRGRGMRKNTYQHKHDIIFYYGKTNETVFNVDDLLVPYDEDHVHRYNKIDENGRRYALIKKGSSEKYSKVYLKDGIIPDDVWKIPFIHGDEYIGYPGQKPENLLKPIILGSSNPGDVVLDPFCGGGTTLIVADRWKRKWIGIDITYVSIGITKRRFEKYNPYVRFGPVVGEPLTIEDVDLDFLDMDGLTKSEQLEKCYQFQWWVLDLVDARPEGEMVVGPDGGFDGVKILEMPNGETTTILYEAKSGKNLKTDYVDKLNSVLTRKNADMGVLISRCPITKSMKKLADGCGIYSPPGTGRKYDEKINRIPKIQLFTIEELMDARRNGRASPIVLPELTDITFKRKQQEVMFERRGTKQKTSGIQELECRNVLRNWE